MVFVPEISWYEALNFNLFEMQMGFLPHILRPKNISW
jgi:hypothetical protein